MAISKLAGSKTDVLLWAPLEEVEAGAQKQLLSAASLSQAVKVLAMPDVHFGHGVAVGSVVALKDAVCPNIVGVDIGCGMMAYRTNLTAEDMPKDLAPLRARIESLIPMGVGQAHEIPCEIGARPEYTEMWERVAIAEQEKCSLETSHQQMGSLGSGNHFIEVCLDAEDKVWLMLHSGSRGFGNQVASAHQARAAALPINSTLPDLSLAVFERGTKEFANYWRDMLTAQLYAKLNRDTMFELLLQALKMEGLKVERTDIGVNCHHNYALEEVHDGQLLIVARKGAISAKLGEVGIIPGAMGRKSYIVEGLGNVESLMSASHGAGRKMGRKQAEKTFTLDDLRASTKGVECYIGKEVLDEIAESYKDIEKVMANQVDLVRPLYELRSILTAKGHDEKIKADRKASEKDRHKERDEARQLKGKQRWNT
jgi:tRNA-splicing ligase RtcB